MEEPGLEGERQAYVEMFNRYFASVFQDRKKKNLLESENRKKQEIKSIHSERELKESLRVDGLSAISEKAVWRLRAREHCEL